MADVTTPTRGHRKKERTRRRLVDAALDVIAERGEGFSVTDVVARAEVSNGTFYNYFDDRDALISAIVPEVLASFTSVSDLAVGAADPAERFARITARGLAQAAAAPERMRVLLRLVAARRTTSGAGPFEHLRDDLVDGAASGRFDLESVDAALDVVVGGVLAASNRVAEGEAEREHASAVVAQLLRSLGLDASEARALAAEAVRSEWGQ